MPKKFIVMFNDKASYRKYKQDVIDGGGNISNDYGETVMGFAAVMPDTLVQLIQSSSLASNGIHSFEPDSVVTIQD